MEVTRKAGFWLHKNGSLHLAYHQDELNVEFYYDSAIGLAEELLALIKPERLSKQHGSGLRLFLSKFNVEAPTRMKNHLEIPAA